MKCQKSLNEFRNESIYEIERNKPMVRLDTQKCQAQKLQNAEMPETENARKKIHYRSYAIAGFL